MAKIERSQRIEVLKKEFLKKLDSEGNFLGFKNGSDGVYYPPNSPAFEPPKPPKRSKPLRAKTVQIWLIALTSVLAINCITVISILASMPTGYGGKLPKTKPAINNIQ